MAVLAATAFADLPNGTHTEPGPSQNPHQPLASLSPERYEPQRRILLELQDGTSVIGRSFGAEKSAAGECVFSTSMVGYPESITDPSFRGQILVMTYPLQGNYGVPARETRDPLLKDLPAFFESNEIHITGLVVASYAGDDYSHHLASSSLGDWLRENNIPAVYGVDTRLLTKRIRDGDGMLGRMRLEARVPNGVTSEQSLANGEYKATAMEFEHIEWTDPNELNLVAEVSCREPQLFFPRSDSALFHPCGRPIRVICVDVGLKYNQLRCLVSRGVEVLRVPWDYDFPKLAGKDYDGLFISNGPGDPAILESTIANIRSAMHEGRTPIFGICLGHQLLARAAGASTMKIKFGNRGSNVPCTSTLSGTCYVTSQNHGFAVDAANLPLDWQELFVNANDGTNEGIRHKFRPFLGIQFHPESFPGPCDIEFLFDVFIDTILRCSKASKALLEPMILPSFLSEDYAHENLRVEVKKVLVLGSGGISIGQAGEFDYSGSQAIKALKEEEIETILVNPNIATCQTSPGFADKVYFLAVNPEVVRKVIKREQPQGILLAFGGQTALQVGVDLEEEFLGLGVKVLGTPVNTIKLTEDRELFARRMDSINIPCAAGQSATSLEQAIQAADAIGYPVIIRAAYALGGLGSGFAENQQQLEALCNKAFAASPQVLVEKSLKGWKEIEFEVVRDAYDNCVAVCGMENFDPLGIHTADSIVVAPIQTLSNQEYQRLRTAAIKIVRHLEVVGECNVQFAFQPDGLDLRVIEVNARLSRSSALASKATGYPLAYIAAKLSLGYALPELRNSVTRTTTAHFEPSLDYIVTKIPVWDLNKFQNVKRNIGSAMKSVGEVMAIGRTFEESIQKAIRAVDYDNDGFSPKEALMTIDIDTELQTPSDQRLFAIANALHAGYTVDKIWRMTKIDKWFLTRLKKLSDFGRYLSQFNLRSASLALLRQAKILGFSDRQLRKFWNSNELAVRTRRVEAGITPYVKQIDTVAAEVVAQQTNYLYMTYSGSEHDINFEDHGIVVLGSGAYRIGSSVEYDYCSVRTVTTLRQQGFKTIMINLNPETVSTDFDLCDRLYFENIDLERVLDIWQLERSSGIIPCMGGQIPQNIVLPLYRCGVKILGTHPERINDAENRFKFSRMLDSLGVDQPAWKELTSFEEATRFCDKVTYPVLVRPSFVLSGAGMRVVYSQHDLQTFLAQATAVSAEHPVVISKFISEAKEIEVDAVARNGKVIMSVVSEHLENAGVHSGDATLILPPQDLDPDTVRRVEMISRMICKTLDISGPTNIQFIAKDNHIKVIECNLRASRSFPFICRTLDIDLIEMATRVIMDLPTLEYTSISVPKDYVGVKSPQFSFSRLLEADPVLGVEMASTGECCCFGQDRYSAYLKSLLATGFRLPSTGVLLSLGSHNAKVELLPSIQKLRDLGFKLFSTPGTFDFLDSHGISSQFVEELGTDFGNKSEFSLLESMANKEIDLYINLPSRNKFRRPANYISMGYRTRRMAVDYQIPLVTNVKNAKMLIEAMSRFPGDFEILDIDCKTTNPLPDAKHSAPNGPLTLRPYVLGQISNSYFKGIHILSVSQFKREHLHLLFSVAQEMRLGVDKHGILDILKGKLLCLCFYEPSTRTSASFDAAMQRLGGRTMNVTGETSSVRKGESLSDTLRTVGSYADAIVLRHPDPESGVIAAKFSPVPVICGGFGSLEHTTQAFLDLFTIREELGTVNGLTITFVGDLRYGRTVHSLLQLLQHYKVHIQLINAKGLSLPVDIRKSLLSTDQLVGEAETLDPQLIRKSDVLYCTRIQKERFEDPALYEEAKDQLVVNNAVLSHAKSKMIVMHPLPRNDELHSEVDTDERAAYFRQVRFILPYGSARFDNVLKSLSNLKNRDL